MNQVPKVSDIIRGAMEAKGMKNVELARKMGVSKTTAGQWVSGVIVPHRKRFPKLEKVLGLPPGTFGPQVNVAIPPDSSVVSRRVPLIDIVDAGRGAVAVDPYPAGMGVDYLDVNVEVSERTFALEVRGPSMEPVYFEGDLIIVDPAVNPLPDDDVVVNIPGPDGDPGENVFKRYKPRGAGAYDLVPLNPDYPTITVNSKNPGKIIGTVVERRHFRKRRQ